MKVLRFSSLLLIFFIFKVSAQEKPVQLFKNEQAIPASLKKYLSKGSVYSVDENAIKKLLTARPVSFTLQFHFENKDWLIELKSASIFSKGFFVRDADNKLVNYDRDKVAYYKGKIKNNPGAFAAVSILHNEIVAVLADEKGNINIGALNNQKQGVPRQHIIYREQDQEKIKPFECGTASSADPLPQFDLPLSTNTVVNTEPVDIYFEADYKCYQNNGSNTTNTVNWATALFNVVTTLYDNDSINVKMSGIKIWTVADPYIALTYKADVLYAFSSNMSSGIPGDLAHFLSQRNLGGGIAWVNTLCGTLYSHCAVSGDLSNNFNPLPYYSWSTMVVTHEIGHNLASNHTHWCGWPGGAIDNCSTTEYGCALGPAPVNGGTIMSYCHQTSYGINLMNGFGPLPGNLIRNTVRNNSCIYPHISFNSTGQTVIEEDADSPNGCLNYKLINIKLALNYTPIQPAIISLLPTPVNSPGLVIGVNKDVSISPMNFTLTDTTPQVIQLRVYNDALVEDKETLKLDYSIAPNGTNAIKNGTYQLDIISLDHRPDSTINQLLYYEPFDSIGSGLGQWTQTVEYGASSPNRWVIGTNGDPVFPGKSAFISSNGSTAGYAGSSIADSSIIRLESPVINATGFSNMVLNFLNRCSGQGLFVQQTVVPVDFGKVFYSVNSGATWSPAGGSIFNNTIKAVSSTVLPSAADNSPTLKIAFEWRNNSSIVNYPPLIVDSITITGTGACPIQSAADTANTDEEYLGPGYTIHFYNPVTKNIIASIVNESTHDFGCTKVEIIRTGNGAAPAWGNYAAQMIASKSYKVTSANNDTISPYEISLYYTSDEINGWANATGNTVNDLSIVKTTADITQAPPSATPQFSNYNSVANYGLNNKVLTARFTGFSSFGLAKAGITTVCPGNTQQLFANETGSSYQWQVNSGSGYTNLTDNIFYSGSNTAVVSIINAPTSWYGYKYRCVIGNVQGSHYSIEYILKFELDWMGATSNAWEETSNWNCNKLPDGNTDVFIKSGAAFNPFLNTNTGIRSLKLSNAAIVRVKNGVQLQINN